MLRKRNLLKTSILFWVTLCATTAAAQMPTPRALDEGKTLNYGFVSPNTRDNLKLEEAIQGLNSVEESNLIKEIGDVGCRMRLSLRWSRALGSWSTGTEHSVLLRVNADEPTVRYLVSRLGWQARQKSVLYFHRRQGGAATIYILQLRNHRRGLRTVARIMDQVGIAFRALVPVKASMIIYIVDLQSELRLRVLTAAKRLRASVYSQEGNAEFISNDVHRQMGAMAFEREITNYEANHPPLAAPCRKRQLRSTGAN